MHLRIKGRVQGVAYRAYTSRQARQLGLCGWVRNCSDGTVELLAEGDETTLKQLEQWCWQGSPSASVSDIKTSWLEYIGDLDSFSIKYV